MPFGILLLPFVGGVLIAMLLMLTKVNLHGFFRDRILHALLGVFFFILVLVPVFSLFSMRQVQELAITLTLSVISWVLLVFAVLLGASSIWRDMERRYTISVLGMPVGRSTYLFGKWVSIAIFLTLCVILLGLVSFFTILVASAQYPSELPFQLGNFAVAIFFSLLKYLLLASIALFFSALSTSFFLPLFGTLALYLAGGASQQAMEYVSGPLGASLSPVVRVAAKGFYYLLPNFSAFDLTSYAVYALPLDFSGLLLTLLYFITYTAIILWGAMTVFNRRDLV
jgi:ABC-type transport system involved in multi-copper enzyme maturation permease subunit